MKLPPPTENLPLLNSIDYRHPSLIAIFLLLSAFSMADLKGNSIPPAVPPKEPIKPKDSNPPLDASTQNVPQHQIEISTISLDNNMTPKAAPGTIRMDNMRSYRDAANGQPEHRNNEPSRPKPRPRAPVDEHEVTKTEQDGRQDLMDVDASQAALADGSSMEAWNDAVPYQSQPNRKSSLPPTAEEEEPDDDFPGFSQNSFTRRKDQSKPQEDHTVLQRHLVDLTRRHRALVADKQIVEEKAQRMAEKINNMKQRMNCNMTEVERSNEELATKVEKLMDENRILREELNDAQSHIFSLQPYRKDLTPEEVGRVRKVLPCRLQTSTDSQNRNTTILFKRFRTGSKSSWILGLRTTLRAWKLC